VCVFVCACVCARTGVCELVSALVSAFCVRMCLYVCCVFLRVHGCVRVLRGGVQVYGRVGVCAYGCACVCTGVRRGVRVRVCL